MLGFHCAKEGRKMHVAIAEDVEYISTFGIERPALQIFVVNPQSYKETLSDVEKEEVRKIIATTGLPLVIHGSYVDNPWNGNLAGIENIKVEMRIARQLGATGVVVHLGPAAHEDRPLERLVDKLGELPADVKRNVVLWLETNSIRKDGFETPDKIADLFNRLEVINGSPKDPHALRFGLCVDTAHLHACGYSLDTYAVAEKWLGKVKKYVLDRGVPMMFHLNDDGNKFGSGKDLHKRLTKGNIWRHFNEKTGHLDVRESGIAALWKFANDNNCVVILERDSGVAKDLKLLAKLPV